MRIRIMNLRPFQWFVFIQISDLIQIKPNEKMLWVIARRYKPLKSRLLEIDCFVVNSFHRDSRHLGYARLWFGFPVVKGVCVLSGQCMSRSNRRCGRQRVQVVALSPEKTPNLVQWVSHKRIFHDSTKCRLGRNGYSKVSNNEFISGTLQTRISKKSKQVPLSVSSVWLEEAKSWHGTSACKTTKSCRKSPDPVSATEYHNILGNLASKYTATHMANADERNGGALPTGLL